jgi:DNA polymerase III delta prime subunit
MQALIDLYKNSEHLHHAYFFVEHKVGEFVDKLKNFLEEMVGIKTSSNPDFWHGEYETLTIDDARMITESSSRRDFANGRKVFIIQANFITEEAQNALLKVFEEPTPGTHFFIISPQDMLLPTLRSRVMVIAGTTEETENESILDLKMNERLAKVKEITEAISDEESTKQDAIIFLNRIEKELHTKGIEKSAKALEICELARTSLYDRGAPVKIILENVMLSI